MFDGLLTRLGSQMLSAPLLFLIYLGTKLPIPLESLMRMLVVPGADMLRSMRTVCNEISNNSVRVRHEFFDYYLDCV